MNKTSAAIIALLFAALHSPAVFAASLTVAVKQVNPDGAVQTVNCVATCSLPLTINAGQSTEQSLTVQIRYIPRGAILTFQAPNGYFYNSDTVNQPGVYNITWIERAPGNDPVTYYATLLQPLASSIASPPLIAALDAKQRTPHTPAATLAITLTPVP